jgi:Ca2+-binding EF-hand superfamily protein
MKKQNIIITTIGLVCLGASAVNAQEGERKGPPGGGGEGRGARGVEYLKSADANADGKISKEEFVAHTTKEAEQRFGTVDGNADGVIDQAEIASIAQSMGEGRDGGMRRPEGDGGEGGFRRPPGGGESRPQGDRPQGGRPGGPGGAGGPGGGMGMMNPVEIFGRMDKNTDGAIDLAEYTEGAKQETETRFKRMDENNDGKVTKEELTGALQRMRQMMGGGRKGMRRPEGGEGGFRRPGGGGGEGGFRRPPSGEGTGRPRPEVEGDKPAGEQPKKEI